MSKQQVAIITGAGSGIGRATAIELAAAGWRCAMVGRRAAKLAETAAAMHSRTPNAEALVIAADIAEPSAPDRIIAQVIERWGGHQWGVDVLINNAATFRTGPIHESSDEALRESFEVNAIAPVRLVRSVWPHMLGCSGPTRGRIINVSSMSSVDPFPGLGVYGMTKCALEGLTRAINNECKSHGIIAFSLVLGAVETEMLRSFVPETVLPRNSAKDPGEIARIIVACAQGQRDADADKPIVI